MVLQLRSVIDKRYALSELPAAIGYVETGRTRGKVVIVPEWMRVDLAATLRMTHRNAHALALRRECCRMLRATYRWLELA